MLQHQELTQLLVVHGRERTGELQGQRAVQWHAIGLVGRSGAHQFQSQQINQAEVGNDVIAQFGLQRNGANTLFGQGHWHTARRFTQQAAGSLFDAVRQAEGIE